MKIKCAIGAVFVSAAIVIIVVGVTLGMFYLVDLYWWAEYLAGFLLFSIITAALAPDIYEFCVEYHDKKDAEAE